MKEKEIENMLKKIGKMISKDGMSDEDSLTEFEGGFVEELELSPQDMAQDMIYDAMDMYPGKERKKLIKEALNIYPHLADAWILLAEEESKTKEEELEFYKKAVQAGEKDLGEKFFKENRGHFWGVVESRPYMRAKLYLARSLWDLGSEDEAIKHYKDCLRLNPNDNQGIRYILVVCLLIKNDLVNAEKILKKYNENFGAYSLYNLALLLFKKLGPLQKANLQLKKSVEANPFVEKYLLGKMRIPKQIPLQYSMGSREEATLYVVDALRAWEEAEGALDWVKAQSL